MLFRRDGRGGKGEGLKKFSARYPNIQIDIVEENSHTLEEKLLMGAINL